MNSLYNLLFNFLNQPILPEIMQSLSVGLITVTIAIAIFLSEKGTVLEFDRIVILEKVIKGKSFLISLLLLFLPLFLWDIVNGVLRGSLFILYLLGVIGFLSFLIRSYKWIKEIETEDKRLIYGYRQKKRLEYFEEISTEPHRLIAWEFIFELKNKTISEELVYLKNFIHHVNVFLDREDEKNVNDYLISLKKFINYINLEDWIIFSEIFNALLLWHYKLSLSFEEKEENQERYIHILRRLIKTTLQKGLQLGTSSMIFKTLKKFVDERIKKINYIKRLFEIIAPEFFENIYDSPDRYDIWSDYFPMEWKITKENLFNSENLIAKLWLDQFLEWTKNRMIKMSDEDIIMDKQLNDVSDGLFPKVDQNTWSIILTFLIQTGGNIKLIKDFVETPRIFGLSIQAFSIWPKDDLEEEQQIHKEFIRNVKEPRNNALELALIIFKNHFTEKKLKEYIRELEQLPYIENSREAKYRDQTKKIFEDMINLLIQQQ